MKKVPELRFKEFTDEWEEKKLGECIKIFNEKVNPLKEKKEYPCIELESLSQNSGKVLKVFNSSEQKSVKNKFGKNQILFGKLRPYLRKYWYTRYEGVCSSEIWVFYSDNNLNKFLYYLIQTDKVISLSNITSGTKMPRADWSLMKDEKIFICDRKEQQKIADFLSAVDEKIEKSEKKVELLKDYKKGMMQKIFAQEIRFKDENRNDYSAWEEKRIGEVLTESKILPESQDLEKRITVKLNLKGIEKRKITPEEKEGITINYLRKEGQFIYGKQNFHKGAFGIIPKELDGFQSSTDIPSFDFNFELVFPKYFLYYFSQEIVYKNLENIASGTGSKRIQPKIFFKEIIVLPNLEEQQKIADFLSAIDEKIEKEEKKVEELKEFKKGLLQKMFV